MSSFGSKTLHGFFGQPPDVAIQYLENKQLVPSKNWYDIRDAAHNQAFTVANLARIDLLERGGYTIESSEGHLFTDVVSVGHNESANITRLKLPSMEIPFKTDAGFNAAPSTGATTQLIKKTAPDIIKQLPEHPVFSPSNATVDDFVKLGQQRLNDVLNIPATANKSIKEILDSATTSALL